MAKSKEPLILLIGGAPGAGKSTLAKNLCHHLNITHRLSTGFVREIIHSTGLVHFGIMSRIRFGLEDRCELADKWLVQSTIGKQALSACIDRAYNEGTSLIIEGIHVVPGLIQNEHVTAMIVLTLPYAYNEKRLQGNTHAKRKLTKDDINAIEEMSFDLSGRANAEGAYNFMSFNEKEVLEIALKTLEKRHGYRRIDHRDSRS